LKALSVSSSEYVLEKKKEVWEGTVGGGVRKRERTPKKREKKGGGGTIGKIKKSTDYSFGYTTPKGKNPE